MGTTKLRDNIYYLAFIFFAIAQANETLNKKRPSVRQYVGLANENNE